MTTSPDQIVRFRDLRVTRPELRQRLLDEIGAIFDSGQLLMGPKTAALEAAIATFCGRDYCVGVSSGTDALYLMLRAAGIGSGDEVVCPVMSWVATANAIAMTGATPVFVDVLPDQNIDPARVEAAITPRTKAIMPVHFTGRLADMAALSEIARVHGLQLLEDAAQAFGAERNGVRAGAFGDAGAFSLNPMKVLAGYGESGAVVTDDPEVYRRLLAMRYLGTVDKERCEYLALNAKMDEIQAALLLISLEDLPSLMVERRRQAAIYTAALADIVICPPPPGADSTVFDYQIQAEDRDGLKAHLAGLGIETRVKHPILMSDQPIYRHLPPPDIPVARHLVARILSLPLHEKLSPADQDRVVAGVRGFYRRS